MRTVAWILVAMLSTPAGAQTIHRCVTRNGGVAYQSEACSADALRATTKRYHAPPDDPQAMQRLKAIDADMERRRQVAIGKSSASARQYRRVVDKGAARCTAARARQAQTLERVGLKRTFDLLRRLDDAVRAACESR